MRLALEIIGRRKKGTLMQTDLFATEPRGCWNCVQWSGQRPAYRVGVVYTGSCTMPEKQGLGISTVHMVKENERFDVCQQWAAAEERGSQPHIAQQDAVTP